MRINLADIFSRNKLIFLYCVFIFYLVVNTGIVSDDFDAVVTNNKLYFVETPVEYLTHFVWYRFFGINNQVAINILKVFYMLLSFYLIEKFFSIYLAQAGACFASFLFIFSPTHDSTVYFFMSQYLTLSFAFYLYAYYLASRKKLALAFCFSLLASFISYGSSVIALALFTLFALNKKFKKGLVLLIPNIIYTAYFIPINIIMRLGSPRIIEELSLSAWIKQFVVQVLTFIDANVGPSIWLKIYYSFSQITPASFLMGAIFIIIFYKALREVKEKYDSRLIISLVVLLLASFLMFSLTGRYPQMAFNLGNRVTIYGSLMLAYLAVLIPVPKVIRTLFFAVMVFSIFGISSHWKGWNLRQQIVIQNIKNNLELKNYNDKETIFVSGNQYSNYGPLSHIEFFSESWVLGPVFKLALGRDISLAPINRRNKYADGYLIDTKYNQKIKIGSYLNVYDSEKDSFFKLKPDEINSYIVSLAKDQRHWIQLLDIKAIKDVAVRLMPRLNYILDR